ncbi:unnamed protein product, partial [Protopolystoma xenopodis]
DDDDEEEEEEEEEEEKHGVVCWRRGLSPPPGGGTIVAMGCPTSECRDGPMRVAGQLLSPPLVGPSDFAVNPRSPAAFRDLAPGGPVRGCPVFECIDMAASAEEDVKGTRRCFLLGLQAVVPRTVAHEADSLRILPPASTRTSTQDTACLFLCEVEQFAPIEAEAEDTF